MCAELERESKNGNFRGCLLYTSQNLAAAKAALRGVITQTENEQRRGIQKRVVEADEIRSVQKGDRVRLLNVGGVIATVLAPADRDGGVQVQACLLYTSRCV